MSKEDLILKLFEINAIKFGQFTLKTGIVSPIYIDLRLVVSYPQLLSDIAKIMWEELDGVQFDLLCGVPYTALPIGTALSIARDKPMLMRRKEAKKYGTKKIIEGVYETGQNCLIVEDLVTSGSSVLETVEPLEDEGLKVTDVIVLLDRQQGGRSNLETAGYRLHSVLSMKELLDTLQKHGKIGFEMTEKVSTFLQENNTGKNIIQEKKRKYTYDERAEMCTNGTARKFLSLMENKKTNLAIAADLKTKREILELADLLGPEICLFKTHIDIVQDFDQSLTSDLTFLAKKHNFMIFEDRKFADIGNTVVNQYESGMYKIADWADIVNAHTLPGPGIVDGLKEVGKEKDRGLLLLADMSSEGNLFSDEYKNKTIQMADENSDFVIGFVSMKKISEDPRHIYFTPGVKLVEGTDELKQQYRSPRRVVNDSLCDVIIVGRGIYNANDPLAEAKKYREAGWRAYTDSLYHI